MAQPRAPEEWLTHTNEIESSKESNSCPFSSGQSLALSVAADKVVVTVGTGSRVMLEERRRVRDRWRNQSSTQGFAELWVYG
jgi:hypothetical protein